MAMDPRALRTALGQFATGVTVVTLFDEENVHGMTANSFTSVSLDPPLVLVSIDKRNRTHALIAAHQAFAVNVLSESQEGLSRYFAGDRSQEAAYTLTAGETAKSPVIAGCLAWFDCTLWQSYDGGDHTLYVGEVQAYDAPGGKPLLFVQGRYAGVREE